MRCHFRRRLSYKWQNITFATFGAPFHFLLFQKMWFHLFIIWVGIGNSTVDLLQTPYNDRNESMFHNSYQRSRRWKYFIDFSSEPTQWTRCYIFYDLGIQYHYPFFIYIAKCAPRARKKLSIFMSKSELIMPMPTSMNGEFSTEITSLRTNRKKEYYFWSIQNGHAI